MKQVTCEKPSQYCWSQTAPVVIRRVGVTVADVVGNDMAGRSGEAFADAPGVGGGLAATGSPVQTKVKALGPDFRVGKGLVFGMGGTGKRHGADDN